MIDKKMSIIEIEQVYDLIAGGIDKAGPDKTALFLAKLSLALANLVGDSQAVANAVLAAGRDL
jgi:outer membrane murein-binding lipoprotein Lpp